MKTPEAFERQIARIHELLERSHDNVAWNDHIPDPDNPSAASDCKSGYTTTIVVQDSSGAPIRDVNVTIKLSCGDQATESRKTNGQGEAVFHHSLEEIRGSEVALNNNETALSNGPSGCTGDQKNKRCVVRARKPADED